MNCIIRHTYFMKIRIVIKEWIPLLTDWCTTVTKSAKYNIKDQCVNVNTLYFEIFYMSNANRYYLCAAFWKRDIFDENNHLYTAQSCFEQTKKLSFKTSKSFSTWQGDNLCIIPSNKIFLSQFFNNHTKNLEYKDEKYQFLEA